MYINVNIDMERWSSNAYILTCIINMERESPNAYMLARIMHII
jgi:hypothetical protein